MFLDRTPYLVSNWASTRVRQGLIEASSAKPSFEDSVHLEQIDHSGLLVTLDPTSDDEHEP